MKEELVSLLKLIDEENDNSYQQIKAAILKHGFEAKELLLEKNNTSLDELSQERIQDLIEAINYQEIEKAILDFVDKKELSPLDIWALFVLFAEENYGFLPYERELQQILKDAWLEINNDLSVLENANNIYQLLTEKYHFDIADDMLTQLPESYYLHQIITSNICHSFSFQLLFWFIGFQCGLPLSFVRKEKGKHLFILIDFDTDNQRIKNYSCSINNKKLQWTEVNIDDFNDDTNSRKLLLFSLLEEQAASYKHKGNFEMESKLLKLSLLLHS